MQISEINIHFNIEEKTDLNKMEMQIFDFSFILHLVILKIYFVCDYIFSQ